ncbi:preprotein translocase subunit SecG [Candidatus Microgenomates bacterium]|nr:MAG: preprotein translocase subunit SecG [Candidatus Microgenomates bacterium]
MILTIIQIIVSVLLIVAILLQARGTGLSSSFGGGGEFFQSRRSIERVLVYGTVILAVFFGALSIILLFPHK